MILNGNIELEKVNFSYDKQKEFIKQMDLQVKKRRNYCDSWKNRCRKNYYSKFINEIL